MSDNIEERIEEEIKIMEEKHTTVLEQIRVKSEELSRLKESALIIVGAKSMLSRLKNGNE